MAASYSVQYIYNLVDRFTRPSKNMARSARQMAAASREMAASARQITGALSAANGQIVRTGKVARTTEQRVRSLAYTMRALRTAGRGLLTGGMIGGMGGGFMSYMAGRTLFNFELAMNRVQSLMDSASPEQMARVRKEVRLLGMTTEFTATKVAAGAEELARAGYKDNDLIGMLGPTVRLASAAQVSMKEAADIATNISKSFGRESAGEVAHVVDILAQAATNTNANIQQLAQSMKYAGPVARRYGSSLEETTAYVMGLAQVGLKADQAGTGMARMFNYLQAIGKKDREALASVGFKQSDFFTADGNSVGPIAIVKMFKEAEKKYGKLKVNEVINQVFAQRGGRILMAALERPIEEFEYFNEILKQSAGRAQRMRDILMSGLPGAFLELQAAIEGLVITMGTKGGLNETLISMAQGIKSFTQYLESLDPAILSAISHFLLFTSIIGAIVIPLGIFFWALSAIPGALWLLKGAMLAVLAPLRMILAPLAMAAAMIGRHIALAYRFAGVLGAVAIAFRGLRNVLLIGLAVDGVITLISHFKELRAVVTDIANAMATLAMGGSGSIDRSKGTSWYNLNKALEDTWFGKAAIGMGLAKPIDDILGSKGSASAIPKAEADKTKVEAEVKGQIEPLDVKVQTPGSIDVNVNGLPTGQQIPVGATTNAPRGVSTEGAGQAAPSTP